MPKEEWKVITDHHEPLVTPEVFALASAYRPEQSTKRKREKHPLTGKIYCGGCGYAINYKPQRNNGKMPNHFWCRKHSLLQIPDCCTYFRADILEEIVGNIEDEHDEETNMVELQPDGSYLMSGMAPFDEVVEVLGIPLDEEDDFETLNGFLISLIDKIPSDDEVFSTTAYGYLFEILSVENKMIQKVHVIKLPEEKASEVELADGTCQNEE